MWRTAWRDALGATATHRAEVSSKEEARAAEPDGKRQASVAKETPRREQEAQESREARDAKEARKARLERSIKKQLLQEDLRGNAAMSELLTRGRELTGAHASQDVFRALRARLVRRKYRAAIQEWSKLYEKMKTR